MKNLQTQTEALDFLNHFNLLANQVVEGFISGIHKSPFHGFSSEFAEHKIYNPGESTKNIDWKVYAKTDKLYVKTYDDETNLRCHIIFDNSSSMHYPKTNANQVFPANKIQYAALMAAALLKLIKKQRDAAGLTIFSDKIDFTTKEQGNERHHNLLIEQLNLVCFSTPKKAQTNIAETLHLIAEKIHKRSLIIIFSDMFSANTQTQALLQALQHLKHNKHKVVLFHVLDKKTEMDFNFEAEAKKFVDLETGEVINIHTDLLQETYKTLAQKQVQKTIELCKQYQIDYIMSDINENMQKNLVTYLIEKQKFK
ncbi:DUF58 domain-containing protein [Flavobacterium agricola]|uniref:DUF58 domain-containing protein n=1 Tax=Flavobacterium agricola TaxID=2870839 RepID=A0ABY6M1N4_9FLAO|nr:DUF58 domain-containing protein [Flavobacterium agricola]UYW01315.1 DUF58 domain-containing protein [Flavobacterium agricola]